MENLMVWLSFMIYAWFVVTLVFLVVFFLIVGMREYNEKTDFFERLDRKAEKQAAKAARKAARKAR